MSNSLRPSFRVVIFLGTTQRRPSLNRANAGLIDTIPLGLKNRPLQQIRSPIPYWALRICHLLLKSRFWLMGREGRGRMPAWHESFDHKL